MSASPALVFVQQTSLRAAKTSVENASVDGISCRHFGHFEFNLKLTEDPTVVFLLTPTLASKTTASLAPQPVSKDPFT
jgi:hypothetical protein